MIDLNKEYIKVFDDYEGSIHLVSRNEKGEREIETVKNYLSYFYVKTKDISEELKNILKKKYYFTIKEEGEFLKITSNIRTRPMILNELKSRYIQTFEADLPLYKIFMLDNNIKITNEYKILWYDIECDDRRGGIQIGRDRITSIAAIGNDNKVYVFCENNEKIMLEKFKDLLDSYDCIIAWNGYKFDYEYLRKRFILYNIKYNWREIMSLDYMIFFKNSFAVKKVTGEKWLPSYSISNITKQFLKESKLDVGRDEGYGGRLWKLFNEDKEKLKKYNLQDVKLMINLEKKFKILNAQIALAQFVGISLDETQWVGRIIDFYTLKHARKQNIHFKTYERGRIKEEYPGGFVEEAKLGLFKNVVIWDFASLYPNLIRTFGISPESQIDEESNIDLYKKYKEKKIAAIKTLSGNIRDKKRGIIFLDGTLYNNERGVVPQIMDELVEKRLKLKKERDKFTRNSEEYVLLDVEDGAIKVVILGFYGILGSRYSRYFNLKMATSITGSGQILLQKMMEFCEKKLKLKVVGGDTDGWFVEVSDLSKIEETESKMKEFLMALFTQKHYLKIEREKVFSKFIVLAEKKYGGRVIEDSGNKCDYLYYRGTELNKGSETLFTKKLLRECFELILTSSPTIPDFFDIINRYKQQLINKEVNKKDLCQIKSISKMYNEYKNVPAHVQLQWERKEKGDRFFVSQRVPFIVLAQKPLKIVHLDDFKGNYDIEYYWNNVIYPPTERLLKTVFPKFEWEKFRINKNMLEGQKSLVDY